jgi:hypothetical protein
MLFILTGANRLADPHTGGKLPAPNRLLATKPFVWLGSIAYSLYLWHWPLLIFWLVYSDSEQAGLLDGAGVLLVSGVLAYLTTKYVENPLRYRSTTTPEVGPSVKMPLRKRLRRPTITLGSVVVLLGAALTATSFTWREHLLLQSANAAELTTLDSHEYPGAHALLDKAPVPAAPMRPTARDHRGRLHQRFRQRRRDQLRVRRPVRDAHHRSGRRLTRRTLDHRPRPSREDAPLQGGHLFEDGLPTDHRGRSTGDGGQPALSEVPHLE